MFVPPPFLYFFSGLIDSNNIRYYHMSLRNSSPRVIVIHVSIYVYWLTCVNTRPRSCPLTTNYNLKLKKNIHLEIKLFCLSISKISLYRIKIPLPNTWTKGLLGEQVMLTLYFCDCNNRIINSFLVNIYIHFATKELFGD